MQCPACAAENDPSSKFCMACGSALTAAEPAAAGPDAPVDAPAARVDQPSWLAADPPSAPAIDEPSAEDDEPAATEAQLEGAPAGSEAGTEDGAGEQPTAAVLEAAVDLAPADATPPPWMPTGEGTGPAPHHEPEVPPPPPPSGFAPPPSSAAPPPPAAYPAAAAAGAPAGYPPPPPPGQGYAPTGAPPPPNPGAWTPPAPGWTQSPPPPPAPAPPQAYAPPPPPSGYPPPPAPQGYGQAPPPPPPPQAYGQAPPAPPPPQTYGQAPPPPPQAQPAWGQPGPGAYAPPPTAYAPPPAAHAPPPPPGADNVPDPNGLGLAAGRLSSGARKSAKTAVTVAGALLDEGETVEAVLIGRFEGHAAVVVLSDRSLRLVDDREWRPVHEQIPLGPGLEVQGWQDDRSASLTFVFGGRSLVLDQIPDRELAVEMAGRIRYRAGATA